MYNKTIFCLDLKLNKC